MPSTCDRSPVSGRNGTASRPEMRQMRHRRRLCTVCPISRSTYGRFVSTYDLGGALWANPALTAGDILSLSMIGRKIRNEGFGAYDLANIHARPHAHPAQPGRGGGDAGRGHHPLSVCVVQHPRQLESYSSTGNLQVAVANEDKGTTSDLVGRLDAGKQVVSQLKKNDRLGWTFVSADKAVEGVQSGEYYAAIVLPKDFSENLINSITGSSDKPNIIYYVNEKRTPSRRKSPIRAPRPSTPRSMRHSSPPSARHSSKR